MSRVDFSTAGVIGGPKQGFRAGRAALGPADTGKVPQWCMLAAYETCDSARTLWLQPLVPESDMVENPVELNSDQAQSPGADSARTPTRRSRWSWLGPSRWKWVSWAGVLGLLAAVWVGWYATRSRPVGSDFQPPLLTAATETTLKKQCAHCHPFPDPQLLARDAWSDTVWDMVSMSGYGANVRQPADPEAIVHWYQQRAPEKLDVPALATAADTRFAAGPGIVLPTHDPGSEIGQPPFVSHLLLVDIVGDAGQELLVCDLRNGSIVMAARGPSAWQVETVGRVPHPAHAEVADLDNDGRKDIIVANLGSAHALDHVLGSVEWLRQRAEGGFERIPLMQDLGRVSDVQPADLDGDGDVDLIVAEFGWRTTGKLFWLENSADPQQGHRFLEHPLDGLRGASHVDVADLDGDGLLEIIALFSQQHERVKVYRNRLPGRFEALDIHQAPHPAWGYSGMQCVDMDQDGDMDILLTNGDTFDDLLLKPFHGIQWLEQRPDFQFVIHDVAVLPAAYRAEAADLDGDGDRDIVACTFAEGPGARSGAYESLVWWEQVSADRWQRHTLESTVLNHPTLTLGDIDADGDLDVLVGRGSFGALAQPDADGKELGVDIWENRTMSGQ